MYWKIAVAYLAGVSTVVCANIDGQSKIDGCPAGYALTTYVVTVVNNSTSAIQNGATSLPTAISWPANSTHDGMSTRPSSTNSVGGQSTGSTESVPTPAKIDSSTAPVSSTSDSYDSSTSSSPVAKAASSSASSLQQTQLPLVGSVMHGQATSYNGGDVDGTCMFSAADYTLPAGLYGAALSVDNWDNAAWCGACVSVTGPGGKSVKIMIVNQCPGTCGTNNLDLLPGGFEQLADLTLGRINVDWEIVKCDISKPLFLKTKTGSSKYWFSIQVVNSNVPVKSLEVSTDGGATWQPLSRTDYNFFENPSGFGVDFVDVRVTSVTGEAIVLTNVNSASETRTDATSNFH